MVSKQHTDKCILSGIVQSFSRNIETKYPNIGYLMLIITAKYRVSVNERSKNRRDHPYATTRTRTYTKGGDARINKARTDKDVIITCLNIDQLKLEIYGFSTKKENKSIGVNRSRSDNENYRVHCLIYMKNQSVYNRIYIYPYIYVYIHIS